MFQVEISRVLEIVHFFRYKKKVFKLKLPEERAGRTVCLVYGSHLHVQCTSRAVGVREMSCTSHVTQYPSHGTVHASRTSSKLVNEDPDGEVNLPEAEYVCHECRCTWDNARALRRHRTALLVQGTQAACEDEESSTVRRNMPSIHLATGSMELRPVFQPGIWQWESR